VLHLVTAIIKPHRLDEVRDALKGSGVEGLTVTEVRGFGRQAGHTETYRGAEYTIDFVPKVKLEIVVATEDAERIADLVATVARTGTIGDGKIWVAPLDRVMRVRTGEVGADAI
jgi:nitrogen regulatory protein P-II 1